MGDKSEEVKRTWIFYSRVSFELYIDFYFGNGNAWNCLKLSEYG